MSGRPELAVCAPRGHLLAEPDWLREVVARPVKEGLATAAAAVVGDDRCERAAAAAGDARRAGGGEPLFDLASLTKPWIASLAVRLDHRGLLGLAVELGQLWPGCHPRLARRTLEDLLRHRAGLAPWAPLYRRCRSRSSVAALLLGGRLPRARRGTYSDLDYILWGLSAERALGRSLSDLLRGELLTPMGLRGRPYRSAFRIPCRLDNQREVELAAAQGVQVARREPPATGHVQDGNARFLGAPAGHAGLFATPRAVAALAREWLAPGALWSEAAAGAALSGPGRFALGWRWATRRGSGGPALSTGSYGHLGFTGGSVWVDPRRRRVLVLLAHRGGVDADLAPSRRRFHARALAADRDA